MIGSIYLPHNKKAFGDAIQAHAEVRVLPFKMEKLRLVTFIKPPKQPSVSAILQRTGSFAELMILSGNLLYSVDYTIPTVIKQPMNLTTSYMWVYLLLADQGCELDRFLTEFGFKKYLQVRVQVVVLRILFFKFEFGKNNGVRVRSPGLYRSQWLEQINDMQLFGKIITSIKPMVRSWIVRTMVRSMCGIKLVDRKNTVVKNISG